PGLGSVRGPDTAPGNHGDENGEPTRPCGQERNNLLSLLHLGRRLDDDLAPKEIWVRLIDDYDESPQRDPGIIPAAPSRRLLGSPDDGPYLPHQAPPRRPGRSAVPLVRS